MLWCSFNGKAEFRYRCLLQMIIQCKTHLHWWLLSKYCTMCIRTKEEEAEYRHLGAILRHCLMSHADGDEVTNEFHRYSTVGQSSSSLVFSSYSTHVSSSLIFLLATRWTCSVTCLYRVWMCWWCPKCNKIPLNVWGSTWMLSTYCWSLWRVDLTRWHSTVRKTKSASSGSQAQTNQQLILGYVWAACHLQPLIIPLFIPFCVLVAFKCNLKCDGCVYYKMIRLFVNLPGT